MARCLLKGGGLPTKFWAEAIANSVYLINQSPTQAVKDKTPYELWHGEKPNLSYFRVFGCVAFALIPLQKLQKLDEKSEKCVFMGHYPESKAYKLFNPITSKVIVSRDVIFHEKSRWAWESNKDGPMIVVEDSGANKDEDMNNSCEGCAQEETTRNGVS